MLLDVSIVLKGLRMEHIQLLRVKTERVTESRKESTCSLKIVIFKSISCIKIILGAAKNKQTKPVTTTTTKQKTLNF